MENKEKMDPMDIERRSNKAVLEIMQIFKNENLPSMTSLVTLIKAAAILMESCKMVGKDADYMEHFYLNEIGPMRKRVKDRLTPLVDPDSTSN